ncbi:MAG: hypothetical protein ACE361_20950 [Aureliella sp.]
MKLRRMVAAVQIAIGILGILLCFYLHRIYVPRVDGALAELDSIAADVDVQARVGERMLSDWITLVDSAEKTVGLHIDTTRALRASTQDVERSIVRWQSVARGMSTSAGGAAESLHGFASQLPIEIPIPKIESENVELAIPQFQVGKSEIRLPYPTAKLGTTKRRIDLGVTSVDLEVPSLQLGKATQAVSVPNVEMGEDLIRRIEVPRNVGVESRQLLSNEKELLEKTADQLRDSSIGFAEASDSLTQFRDVVRNEVLGSFNVAEDELIQLGDVLRKSSQQELPEIRQRLLQQRDAVERTRVRFQGINGLFPWAILIAALIPGGVLLQGIVNLSVTPWSRE